MHRAPQTQLGDAPVDLLHVRRWLASVVIGGSDDVGVDAIRVASVDARPPRDPESLLGLDARHADEPKGLAGRLAAPWSTTGNRWLSIPLGLTRMCAGSAQGSISIQLTFDSLGSGDHDAAELRMQRHDFER